MIHLQIKNRSARYGVEKYVDVLKIKLCGTSHEG